MPADDDFSHLAEQHTLGDRPVPAAVLRIAGDHPLRLAWRNELGGLTFAVGEDRFVKWSPRSAGVDLDRERDRLGWLAGRHPVPALLDSGSDEDGQWLVTAAMPGSAAVGDRWRARRPEAIRAIAAGLRAFHAVDVADVPPGWAEQVWVGRRPPSLGPAPVVDDPVLVHGDACAPNTLVSDDGSWCGHVDVGDLGVGDRWADLAVASMSLDWNYGEGHQDEFFDAYGIEPDPERIAYYRALWELES